MATPPAPPPAVRGLTLPADDPVLLDLRPACNVEFAASSAHLFGGLRLDAVLTRGRHGAIVARDGAVVTTIAAVATDVVDTTGAGDTYTGVLVARLAAGDALDHALEAAAAAAAIAVSRRGAAEAMPTADEIADPLKLHVQLWNNGVLMQDYNTDDMAHKIARCISWISSIHTLVPGDILACGTNHRGLNPFMDGDKIELEVEGLGRLTINVRDDLKRTWKRETRLERQEQGFDTPTPQLTGKYA